MLTIKIKLRNGNLFFNWMNKLISEDNKVPEHCSELEKVAGSAKYKQ